MKWSSRIIFSLITTSLFMLSCAEKTPTNPWDSFDESAQIEQNKAHANSRMQFKRILSKHRKRSDIWGSLLAEIENFGEENYLRLVPMVLEKDIPSLQAQIAQGLMTYEELTLFYLYRIYRFENDPQRFLNAVIALHPAAVAQARARDEQAENIDPYSLYGMPILLKDNINVAGLPTTAGASVLAQNSTEDAFIVQQLKAAGAVILGKSNLSEWAYYFCSGCPLGYSAIGGQTLNPYGRFQFETGGSSSGSGVAATMNFAALTIGSETSGSILSPSAKNSVVGLKPTLGSISRSGIIPISSSLDTAGPMTKNVLDNWILFNTIQGYDSNDSYALKGEMIPIPKELPKDLKGKKIGYFKSFIEDSLYQRSLEKLTMLGAELTEITPPQVNFQGFGTLLDVDMKKDLPLYLEQYAATEISVRSVSDVIAFNQKDSVLHAPYGQSIFKGIAADSTSSEAFEQLKTRLMGEGKRFFETPMEANGLDAVVSIDNYSAAAAALAHYPALAVPMGRKASGEPTALVFIAPSQSEGLLFELGYVFEQVTNYRQIADLN